MGRLRGAYSGVLFQQLERLFHHGTSVGLTEGELLERFVSGRDETAFEALVARHGPMVLGVCRKLLRDPNDVDDAFQATFLVLVRKAGTLRRCDLLGNWLYGVALRVAARARTLSARRSARFAPGSDETTTLVPREGVQRLGLDPTARGQCDPAPWLHEEISHLPAKYRTPIVLCFFEGLTHDEAAERLGWPLGTVKGRLSRAKDLLRRRLTSRGLTLSAAALVAQLALPDARAAVSDSLEFATLRAAQSLAGSAGASLATTSAVSIPVAALVEGVLRAMILNQVRTLAIPMLFVAGTVATGAIVAASQASRGRNDAGQASQVVAAGGAASDDGGGGSVAQAAAAASREPATASVSPGFAQQLNAARATFESQLAGLRDPESEDIDRLNRWSLMTVAAEQVLFPSEADRQAAVEAHRDRMKKLHELTRKIPISAKNQPVKANQTQQYLDAAETMLKDKVWQDRGNMMGMMRGAMMGRGMAGAGGGMGAMSGGMAGIGGRMGAMGGGMAGAGGRMGAMGGGMAGAGGRMGAMGGARVRDPQSIAKAAADETESPAAETPPKPAPGKEQAIPAKPGPTKATTGQGGYGGDAGPLDEAHARELRLDIAIVAAKLEAGDTNPKNQAIHKHLEEPISMSFQEETPLEDVLKYIKQATTSKTYAGLPIYVDPDGLIDADKTLNSTVRNMDLDGIPLKISLRLLLRQLGLAYCVRDGVLIISSFQGIDQELKEEMSVQEAKEQMKEEAARPRAPAGLQ
jgi:RNA polymerase sigma factor (sigma-70 family)